MESKILTSVKKALGISAEDTNFDHDVMLHTNTALMNLNQLGVGPSTGFIIEDDTKLWTDLLGERLDLEAVKSYIYLKVKILFDPPSSAFVLEAMERQVAEMEWRLNVQAETVQEGV